MNSQSGEVFQDGSTYRGPEVTVTKGVGESGVRRRSRRSRTERSVAGCIGDGDSAVRNKLVVENVGLVAVIARKYHCVGLGIDDLMQDGTLGLMRACQDFDPHTHSTSFSSYAAMWIRSFIYRSVMRHRSLIRLPLSENGLAKGGDLRAGGRRLVKTPIGNEAEHRHQRSFQDGHSGERRDIGGKRRDAIGIRHHLGIAQSMDAGMLEQLAIERTVAEERVSACEEYERLRGAIARLCPIESWIVSERYGLDGAGIWQSGRMAGCERLKALGEKIGEGAEDNDEADKRALATSTAYYRATYGTLSRRCGLSVYRVKQIERIAVGKLRGMLGDATPPLHTKSLLQ